MSILGVAEAAAELEVSPRRVRQMLVDGVLAGEHVGRAWVIDSRQLQEFENRHAEVGRPWSSEAVWAVLALADGEEVNISPVQRSRARKRLARGLDCVAGRLRVRAERRWFYAHPGVLNQVGAAPQAVRSGISAAVENGADLVVGDGFEGYVRAGDLDEVVSRFGLDDQAARPNVLLRVVDDVAWPFSPGQRSAGRAVVAVDLLESNEPRTRRAGVELLERL